MLLRYATYLLLLFVSSSSSALHHPSGDAAARTPSHRIMVTFEGKAAFENATTVLPPFVSHSVKRYGKRMLFHLRAPYNRSVHDGAFRKHWKGIWHIEEDSLLGHAGPPLQRVLEQTNGSSSSSSSSSSAAGWPFADSEPYGLHLEHLWAAGATGGDMTVAVVDSGLVASARALFSRVANAGYDFVSDSAYALDGDGRDADPTDPGDPAGCTVPGWHGTKMAAAVAARVGNALGLVAPAPGATVQIVRALGACSTGYASDVADAILWAAGGSIDGVFPNPTPSRVISVSLVGAGECPSFLQSAITQAVGLGATVVAAAGNAGGEDIAAFFPANCNSVLSVGASTRRGARAPYSNVNAMFLAPGGDEVDPMPTLDVLPAPEHGLVHATSSGTSFSAALAAGVVALHLHTSVHVVAGLRKTSLPMAGALFGLLRNQEEEAVNKDNETDDAWPLFPIDNTTGAGGLQPLIIVKAATACGPGTYAIGDGCVTCPAGTYNPYSGMTSAANCLACPRNTFAPRAGYSACFFCPTNQVASYGSTACRQADLFVTQTSAPTTCRFSYSNNTSCLCWYTATDGTIWNENNDEAPLPGSLQPSSCSSCDLSHVQGTYCGVNSPWQYKGVTTSSLTSYYATPPTQAQACSQCYNPPSACPANCASNGAPICQSCFNFNACSGCGCFRQQYAAGVCNMCRYGYYTHFPDFTSCAVCPAGTIAPTQGGIDALEYWPSAPYLFTTAHYSCTNTAALDGTGAWCPSMPDDRTDYVEIRFDFRADVRGIVTQGRTDYDQWVTGYEVLYAADGVTFVSYGTFAGNRDRNTRATTPVSFSAIAVRIRATSYTGWPSMRLGVIVSSLTAMDTDMTVNVALSSPTHPTCLGGYGGAWTAGDSWCALQPATGGQYVVLDLQYAKTVTAIVVKGRSAYSQLLTGYSVAYSLDGSAWTASSTTGTCDPAVHMVFPCHTPVNFVARYVKLTVTAFYGNPSAFLGLITTSKTPCAPCTTGSYSATPGASACTQCPSGQYTPSPGATACLTCPAGTTPNAALNGCAPCPAGTYNTAAGSTVCTACALGQYAVPGSTACTSCPAGTFSATAGVSSCTSCPPGTYGTAVGATSCVVCPSGYYCLGGTALSILCPPSPGYAYPSLGFFGASHRLTGNPSLTACANACAAGNYWTGDTCWGCPGGTYSSADNALSCSACSPGTYSSGGMSYCNPCNQGGAWPVCPFAGMSVPLACDERRHGVGNYPTACGDCTQGYYNVGAYHCNPCPGGYYKPDGGPQACTATRAGTYIADTGSFWEGPWCGFTTYTPGPGYGNCLQCPLGKFSTGVYTYCY